MRRSQSSRSIETHEITLELNRGVFAKQIETVVKSVCSAEIVYWIVYKNTNLSGLTQEMM